MLFDNNWYLISDNNLFKSLKVPIFDYRVSVSVGLASQTPC